MKKILNWLINSGIWIIPTVFIGFWVYFRYRNPKVLQDGKNLGLMAFGSVIPYLLIIAETKGKPNEKTALQGKRNAMYPAANRKLLSKTPTGIILGKDKRTGRYICRKLYEDGHVLVLGGSGSGKSSGIVIPTVMANPQAHFFVVDIKGELSCKSVFLDSENIIIFNPLDRNSWGYDPLYKLSENSSNQEIFTTMQLIAFSLISLPADLKDPFWKTSARNLFCGLLIHYFKQGKTDFIDLVDAITSRSIKESLNEVRTGAGEDSNEYHLLVQFFDMADETLGGIVAEMNNNISIFANDQDIRYALKHNQNRYNPLMLEENSIFLSIPENKLSAYYNLLQLLINQEIAELELRPENSSPIVVCLDELPRILSAGKLDRLLDGARTLRSRKVCLLLITQSLEALMSAYKESEVDDLISNCSYTVVLDAKSTKTQKQICSWAGKYRVRKQNWNDSGRKAKISVSYDEKDILDPADLMQLRLTGEAIIISPYGYNRVSKVPYYEDRYFRPLAENIKEHNDKLFY